jgi:hypothetical protein
MPRHPIEILALAAVSLLLLAGGSRPARAQFPAISAYAACSPDSSYVIWRTFDPDPMYPEWVGFDVLRRVLPGCDEYVRVNDTIIPRMPGPGYLSHFREPASGVTAEYRVIAVDVDRQELFFPGFCGPCNAFSNCPPLSAPTTVGNLVELAPGFVYVIPCPGTCYPAPYFASGVPAALAPYVGTSVTFRFFGQVGCGGVEGCSFEPDHWETTSCVTPTVTHSWGRLKTLYR